MGVLLYVFIFSIDLSVCLGCVTTDNPSPMFDMGFIVGLLTTIFAYIMMLSSSWSDIFAIFYYYFNKEGKS